MWMIETLNLASSSCTGWCWNTNLRFDLLNGLQHVFIFVLCDSVNPPSGWAFLCGVSSFFPCLCTHSLSLIFLCCHDGHWYCKVYEVTVEMFCQLSLMEFLFLWPLKSCVTTNILHSTCIICSTTSYFLCLLNLILCIQHSFTITVHKDDNIHWASTWWQRGGKTQFKQEQISYWTML